MRIPCLYIDFDINVTALIKWINFEKKDNIWADTIIE